VKTKTEKEITFKMFIPWDDLLEMDIDAMNDEAQEQYNRIDADGNPQQAGYICDISYRLVDRKDQQLVIEVSCLVEDADA